MARPDPEPQQASAKLAEHERCLTIGESPDHPPSKRVPFIRLKGKWLAKAGFTPASRIRLRVMGGCIVITLD